MLDMIKKLFGTNANQEPDSLEDSTKLQIDFAALLVEAARADEDYQPSETALIDKLLMRQFTLSSDDAAARRAKAEAAQANAIDLHQFTRTIKSLPDADKIALIEGLWRIVLSDAVRDPFEDSLIRRVCGLIHVSDIDSGNARKRVEAERG